MSVVRSTSLCRIRLTSYTRIFLLYPMNWLVMEHKIARKKKQKQKNSNKELSELAPFFPTKG